MRKKRILAVLMAVLMIVTLLPSMAFAAEAGELGGKLKVYTKEQKLAQRQFFFWYKPEFRRQITQALQKIGKKDLIGKLFGK